MAFNEFAASFYLNKSDEIVNKLCIKSKDLTVMSNYEEIRQKITIAVQKIFPGSTIQVHFFGSRIIGLAGDESDIDIFINIDERFYSSYAKSNKYDHQLNDVAKALRENPREWRIKKSVLKARIPLITCIYKPMGLECDISMINGLSVCNSKLLAHLFEIQPEAISLYHFVRTWMKTQGLNDMKGYTSCLLVLFYLQTIGLMPTIETVQRGVATISIDGWSVQFNPNRSLAHYQVARMSHYKQDAPGFFKFFRDFNYDSVMQPHNGRFSDSQVYKQNYPKFLLRGFFIAGPINQEINCGLGNDYIKTRFIQLCKDTVEFFDKLPMYKELYPKVFYQISPLLAHQKK